MKKCDVCKTEFETTKSNPHPYCNTCVLNKQKYEYECLECHKKIRTNHYGSTLCSNECINKHKNRDTISLSCLYCKKEFKRPSFTVVKEFSDRVYCSTKCRNNQFSIENPTRYGGAWSRIKNEIKERDSNRCLNCGSDENLEVHHFKK